MGNGRRKVAATVSDYIQGWVSVPGFIGGIGAQMGAADGDTQRAARRGER